jgi:putative toxin-antitoxin system antitoxin component (TIGR02293 family)
MSTGRDRLEHLVDQVENAVALHRATALWLRQLPDEGADRLSRLLARADEMWGDAAKVNRWVQSPRTVLGGKSPAALAVEGEEGLERVMELIGRIEHGIYS